MRLAWPVKRIGGALAMMHLYRVIDFTGLNQDVIQISRAT